MRALRVQSAGEVATLIEMKSDELTGGDVHIESHYSSLNYKDALAVTSKGKILKKFPLNPGIDVSGVVLSSSSSRLKKGDHVLITGTGIGEDGDGGFATEIKASSSSVISLPDGMDSKRAMFFGTAGFTAALAVHRMIQNDQTVDKGPILVTGASGGVGSFSIALLSHLGFEVVALTGKKEIFEERLKKIGANRVVTWSELQLGDRPLESAKFGGAIDNLGGEVLSKIISHIHLWGNVASIGLASGHTLNSTVMPFILRGVSLLGTSSNNCPEQVRHDIWKKLGGDWNAKGFSHIPIDEISLDDVLKRSNEMLARKTVGRTIVNLRGKS